MFYNAKDIKKEKFRGVNRWNIRRNGQHDKDMVMDDTLPETQDVANTEVLSSQKSPHTEPSTASIKKLSTDPSTSPK